MTKFTGCYYETVTHRGFTLDSGEIRVWLYDDGTIYGERDFDNEAFDNLTGFYTVRLNRLGAVLSVTMIFYSDFAGEAFRIVLRGRAAAGGFGGGYRGAFRLREVSTE